MLSTIGSMPLGCRAAGSPTDSPVPHPAVVFWRTHQVFHEGQVRVVIRVGLLPPQHLLPLGRPFSPAGRRRLLFSCGQTPERLLPQWLLPQSLLPCCHGALQLPPVASAVILRVPGALKHKSLAAASTMSLFLLPLGAFGAG
jgi:hypothetical protein